MPQCPQCQKDFVELPRKCPSCMAELDLLVDYVSELQMGLQQAERCTRAGQLSQAVWAYLSVLEVDPDNPVARQQVGQVATAVRQFDRTAPGRRWLYQIRGEKIPGESSNGWARWLFGGILVVILLMIAFVSGYMVGTHGQSANGSSDSPPSIQKDSLMGK